MINSSTAGSSSIVQKDRGRVEDYERFLTEQMLELVPPGKTSVPEKFRTMVRELVLTKDFLISGTLSASEAQALKCFKKLCFEGDYLFGSDLNNTEQQNEGMNKAKAALIYLVDLSLAQLEMVYEGTRPALVSVPGTMPSSSSPVASSSRPALQILPVREPRAAITPPAPLPRDCKPTPPPALPRNVPSPTPVALQSGGVLLFNRAIQEQLAEVLRSPSPIYGLKAPAVRRR